MNRHQVISGAEVRDLIFTIQRFILPLNSIIMHSMLNSFNVTSHQK